MSTELLEARRRFK